MPIKIQIRRNADGEIRETVQQSGWDEGAEYLWSDGNWACDCNREMFFTREGDDSAYIDCSSDRFDVHITDAETGAVLYSEF